MQTQIKTYLKQCRELVQFTHDNGWIDNDSLTFEILAQEADQITVEVSFEEIMLSSAGCCAVRERRWGQLHLTLDAHGVIASEVIA